jgi:hypothetical protein
VHPHILVEFSNITFHEIPFIDSNILTDGQTGSQIDRDGEVNRHKFATFRCECDNILTESEPDLNTVLPL